MRFPNLSWALAERGLRQYRLANLLDVADSWLSRALAGRTNFTAAHRQRIAEILGYPATWLFQEVQPPRVSANFSDSTAPAV